MKVKINNKKLFWFGVGLGIFLILSFLISVPVEGGNNYYTTDSLLGIIINHNVVALSVYVILIAIIVASSMDFTREK